MPYLNLGCLHLLPLITELYFWSIDNQYNCSKTSECYKINLWLELACWKAEISRKRRLNHDPMSVKRWFLKQEKVSWIWNMEPLFYGVHQINSTCCRLGSFFFLLLSSNGQAIIKERSLKRVLPKYPFLKNHSCLFKHAWWTTYASYARRPNCLVYLHF